MKAKVIKALIAIGYSKETAIELIAKYIDTYENCVDSKYTAKVTAEELREQDDQRYGEDEDDEEAQED